jgi:cephalosporin hydroxylase
MRIHIDTDARSLIMEDGGTTRELGLYSAEAFSVLSRQWVRVGWALKYSYGFSWMGRPVIQMPEDMIRIQEAIAEVRPDVILETGVANGGSLIFYASLLTVMGQGRVIGIDIEIRPANRKAISEHALSPRITLIEGSSVDPAVVRQAASLVNPGERVLVILDSCHTKAHVLAELEAYHPLVSPGSYILATDGIMRDLHDVPGGRPDWAWDHPAAAAAEFASRHSEFTLVPAPRPFNETLHQADVTHWSDAWLRRTP